jgi:hypothetical protein
VDGGVLDLRDRLSWGHEEDSERPLDGAGSYQGSVPISSREPVQKALLGGFRRLAIPAEGSAKLRSESEKEPDSGINGGEPLRRQKDPKVDNGTARAAARKVNSPDIVQGNIREQRMRSEINALELLLRHAHGGWIVAAA